MEQYTNLSTSTAPYAARMLFAYCCSSSDSGAIPPSNRSPTVPKACRIVDESSVVLAYKNTRQTCRKTRRITRRDDPRRS